MTSQNQNSMVGFGLSDCLLGLGWLAFTLYANATLPLSTDSAYYWSWSQSLQWSYFDHPPMLAYMLRGMTALLGSSIFALRILPLLCTLLTLTFTYQLTTQLFHSSTLARKALWIAAYLPLTNYHLSEINPSNPEHLFWIGTLYCFYQRISGRKGWHLAWTGMGVGLTLLSKYTGILLALSLFILCIQKTNRAKLPALEIGSAILTSLLVFLPCILWNAQHHWASFLFQLNHGIPSSLSSLHSNHCLEFLASQLYLVNPVFWVVLMIGLIQFRKELFSKPELSVLTLPCIITFAPFMLLALIYQESGLWAGPAYLSGSIIIAHFLDRLKVPYLYPVGMLASILILLTSIGFALIPSTPQARHSRERTLQTLIENLNQALPNLAKEYPVLFSNTYGGTAALHYGLMGHPLVVSLDPYQRALYLDQQRPARLALQQNKLQNATYLIDTANAIQPSFKQWTHCDTRWADTFPVIYGKNRVQAQFKLINCQT